jgi:hypothetical protein
MQIANTVEISCTDQNGAPWIMANNSAYDNYESGVNFNGPLLDAPGGQLGQTLKYWDNT